MPLSAARALRDRRPSAGPWARGFFLAAGCVAGVFAGATDAAPMTPPALDSLRLELVVPPTARPGAAVPVVIRLHNSADRAITLSLVGREIAFDVVVTRDDGAVVWRRLTHAAIQGILQLKTLAAGETLELRDTWRQRSDGGERVPPGNYRVQG